MADHRPGSTGPLDLLIDTPDLIIEADRKLCRTWVNGHMIVCNVYVYSNKSCWRRPPDRSDDCYGCTLIRELIKLNKKINPS